MNTSNPLPGLSGAPRVHTMSPKSQADPAFRCTNPDLLPDPTPHCSCVVIEFLQQPHPTCRRQEGGAGLKSEEPPPPRSMNGGFLQRSHSGGGESGLPPAHFHLTDVDLQKMLIFSFFLFFLSTGDREQSVLLCNQRLCPADNTRGINYPCPAQALEEGADAASQPHGLGVPSCISGRVMDGGVWSQAPAPLLRHKEQPRESP